MSKLKVGDRIIMTGTPHTSGEISRIDNSDYYPLVVKLDGYKGDLYFYCDEVVLDTEINRLLYV